MADSRRSIMRAYCSRADTDTTDLLSGCCGNSQPSREPDHEEADSSQVRQVAERGWDALRHHPMYSISVRRSILLRLTTCLWALWFGVVLAVPAALPTCPAHGEHAGHTMAASTAPGSVHHGVPSHQGRRACPCPGACCCAPVVALVVGVPAELPAVRVASQASRPRFPDAPPSRSAVRYSHPYANGPPVAIVA